MPAFRRSRVSSFWTPMIFFVGVFVFLLCVVMVHAQEIPVPPPTDVTALSPGMQAALTSFLLKMALQYPILSVIAGFLGSMRIWAKPVFSAIHGLIELTPSKKDDGWWASVYQFFTVNPAGRVLAYLLDYLTSIKIIPLAPVPLAGETKK